MNWPENSSKEIIEKAVDSNFLFYLWFVALAIWGGTANYITKRKEDKNIKFSLAEMLGEWTISGFAGLIALYVCMEFEFSLNITAVVTGIAGHMGGRFIAVIETAIKNKLESGTWFNSKKD